MSNIDTTSARKGEQKMVSLDMQDKNVGRLPLEMRRGAAGQRLQETERNAAIADEYPLRGLRPDGRDEKMQDLLDLERRNLLGQDKVLGQRVFSDENYGYLKKKSKQVVAQKLQSLIAQAYDSSDIDDRQRLNAILPEIQKSRLDLVDHMLEQRRFIARLAITGMPDGLDDFQRVISILGGAEAILSHPVLKAVENAGNVGDYPQKTTMFGLFAIPTVDQDPLSDEALTASRPQRLALGRHLIMLFPAFAKGRYNSNNAVGAAWRRDDRDAGVNALVRKCEELCGNMTGLGSFLDGAGGRFDNGRTQWV